MEKKQMEKMLVFENESGSVLIIALIMLVLLTVLGITATSTSNIELQIAGNERNYKRAFYVANAGIEQARASLAAALAQYRANQISTGATLDWSFALDGQAGKDKAQDCTYLKGTKWFTEEPFDEQALSGYKFTVTLWNDEAGSPEVDNNNKIWMQADAEGPNGVKVSVKVMLVAGVTGSSTDSYSQYGGDMTKNFNGNDLNAPSAYDTQIGGKTYTSGI
jgi:Tfp pilus assembly protein PilX